MMFIIAMARALIRDPQLVAKMAAGEVEDSDCVPCNRCIAEMDRGGVRCALRPVRALETS